MDEKQGECEMNIKFGSISVIAGIASLVAVTVVGIFMMQGDFRQEKSQGVQLGLVKTDLEELGQRLDLISERIGQLQSMVIAANSQPSAENLFDTDGLDEQVGASASTAEVVVATEPQIVNATPGMPGVIGNRGQQSVQQMVTVSPTPEQNANYESLKTLLDDPTYVSQLSLTEFAGREELRDLPEPMQMALISKAIEYYNQGYVDREVFMNPSAAQPR